jgi:hypothetical protein
MNYITDKRRRFGDANGAKALKINFKNGFIWIRWNKDKSRLDEDSYKSFGSQIIKIWKQVKF